MQDRCKETLQETVGLHISNHDSEFNKISELIFFFGSSLSEDF